MTGAPFDTGTWEGVLESYYAGAGSELLWLYISIGVCIFALLLGHAHEIAAYRKADRRVKRIKKRRKS